MLITMVGTGSAFAKKYYNNNAIIESKNKRLLIDCGITLPTALNHMNISFSELDAILISHIHADHVGGLEELAYQMMFIYERKPILYIAETLLQPLWENTLRGGLVQGDLNKIEDFFDVRPLTVGDEHELISGITVKLLHTKHIPGKNSYSFILNKQFFYTADMQFDRNLLEKLGNEQIHTIFHDCQLESPSAVHASLDELLTLPESLQQKIWLMHYGDNIENYKGKTGAMRIVEQGKTYSL